MAGFRARSPAPMELRAIPRPAVTLIIDFGDNPVRVDASGRELTGSLVAGLATDNVHFRVENSDNGECLQVRLSPVVVQAALGASPAELHQTVVGLEEVWGRDAERIRDQLRDAASWEDRFAITESMLMRRQQAGPSVDPEIARAWERIVGHGGRVRIDGLAAELGWSRRRFWSRFRSQIGLSPKPAARLVRFDHAVHNLVAGRSPAQVAAEAGYADQSHLHRDVLTFAGATPAAVVAEPWLAVDEIAWAGPAV
jgi:AraC-like DNA-binding protein